MKSVGFIWPFIYISLNFKKERIIKKMVKNDHVSWYHLIKKNEKCYLKNNKKSSCIAGLRYKFSDLQQVIRDSVDILAIAETKIDSSFLSD